MRVLILSDPSSIHTFRWVSALASNNIEIFLYGMNKPNDCYKNMNNVSVSYCDCFSKIKEKQKNGALVKIGYLKNIKKIKDIIKSFKPDIVHAHYASSYGLLGALSGFHPYIISVWGSDVYDFPNVSFIHKLILKFNFSHADKILSTSFVMLKETQKYTSKDIDLTPFGVDISLFKKLNIKKSKNKFIIGTVKSLYPIYGIDVLIKAFDIVVKNNPYLDVQLIIVGDGEQRATLKKICENLNIAEKVNFIGKIDNDKLPEYYNSFSISTFLSYKESFGVVAVESMACECPVVVSDAEGFTELVTDGKSGFIVPKNNIQSTAKAIQNFIDNRDLCDKMGSFGRKEVEKLYNWDNNVKKMVTIYKNILST